MRPRVSMIDSAPDSPAASANVRIASVSTEGFGRGWASAIADVGPPPGSIGVPVRWITASYGAIAGLPAPAFTWTNAGFTHTTPLVKLRFHTVAPSMTTGAAGPVGNPRRRSYSGCQ